MTEPKPAELIEPDERWQLMLGTHADGPVAVVWSVLAVEAALRDRLGEAATRDDGLKRLIGKAEARGWFSPDQAEALRAGAELRNRFTHARTYGVFTPAMVAGALETAHRAIVRVYDGAAG
jgi:hypothetical protein